jgi:hypothetical protein
VPFKLSVLLVLCYCDCVLITTHYTLYTVLMLLCMAYCRVLGAAEHLPLNATDPLPGRSANVPGNASELSIIQAIVHAAGTLLCNASAVVTLTSKTLARISV